MARGWESKSVADQQADRETPAAAGGVVTPGEAASIARRRSLELARARVIADLETAVRPAHRAMLESALRALDEQIRE
jgi:hypothetical protein